MIILDVVVAKSIIINIEAGLHGAVDGMDFVQDAHNDFKSSLGTTVELAIILGRLKALSSQRQDDGALKLALLQTSALLDAATRRCTESKSELEVVKSIVGPKNPNS